MLPDSLIDCRRPIGSETVAPTRELRCRSALRAPLTVVVPPEYHAAELLEKVLPGFRWLTFGGFLIGLAESFVYGGYTGLLVGWLYNAFQRRTAAA